MVSDILSPTEFHSRTTSTTTCCDLASQKVNLLGLWELILFFLFFPFTRIRRKHTAQSVFCFVKNCVSTEFPDALLSLTEACSIKMPKTKSTLKCFWSIIIWGSFLFLNSHTVPVVLQTIRLIEGNNNNNNNNPFMLNKIQKPLLSSQTDKGKKMLLFPGFTNQSGNKPSESWMWIHFLAESGRFCEWSDE